MYSCSVALYKIVYVQVVMEDPLTSLRILGMGFFRNYGCSIKYDDNTARLYKRGDEIYNGADEPIMTETGGDKLTGRAEAWYGD